MQFAKDGDILKLVRKDNLLGLFSIDSYLPLVPVGLKDIYVVLGLSVGYFCAERAGHDS